MLRYSHIRSPIHQTMQCSMSFKFSFETYTKNVHFRNYNSEIIIDNNHSCGVPTEYNCKFSPKHNDNSKLFQTFNRNSSHHKWNENENNTLSIFKWKQITASIFNLQSDEIVSQFSEIVRLLKQKTPVERCIEMWNVVWTAEQIECDWKELEPLLNFC